MRFFHFESGNTMKLFAAFAVLLYHVRPSVALPTDEGSEVSKVPIACVEDLEPIAAAKIPKEFYAYYSGGADDEYTLHDNREAFKRWRFRPRFLRNNPVIQINTTILGKRVKSPIGIAPIAMQRLTTQRGEVDTAEAVSKRGSIMSLSILSTTSMENVAKAFQYYANDEKDGSLWFQLYIYKNRTLTKSIVQRAKDAGYKAIVVTINSAYHGNRRNDIREKFQLPSNLRLANFKGLLSTGEAGPAWLLQYTNGNIDPSVTWDDIAWLKNITSLKIIAKGFITPEDADLAIDAGVDAIWVSNHGGRQLDSTPATIDALDGVLKMVAGRREVYVDGGFRTGGDVAKALAMGARAVFVGLPNIWGLAYDAADGVESVLSMLDKELINTMGLLGASDLETLTPSMVAPAFFMNYCKNK